MKLALRILVTALLAALLTVPTASAKQGGGHGKGAEKAKAAHALKADKFADKAAKKAEKAERKAAKKAAKAARKAAKQADRGAEEEQCGAAPSASEVLGGLFASAEPACESEEESLDLEGLGPGQYCHQLEAWMAENGGDFSKTFGTEGSGLANDHGKCASRRAHGEDLTSVAQQVVEESEQAQAEAPAAAELAAVLRLLSF
jgi:hypothetical protein